MKELGFFLGTEFQVYINISGTKKPFLDCFYGNSKVEEKNCLMATTCFGFTTLCIEVLSEMGKPVSRYFYQN